MGLGGDTRRCDWLKTIAFLPKVIRFTLSWRFNEKSALRLSHLHIGNHLMPV